MGGGGGGGIGLNQTVKLPQKDVRSPTAPSLGITPVQELPAPLLAHPRAHLVLNVIFACEGITSIASCLLRTHGRSSNHDSVTTISGPTPDPGGAASATEPPRPNASIADSHEPFLWRSRISSQVIVRVRTFSTEYECVYITLSIVRGIVN